MKIKYLILIVFLFNFFSLYSQKKEEINQKIIIAKYSLYPYSSSYFNHDETTPSEKKSFDIALRKTKELKYVLLSNFKSNKAVFYLDTIVTTPIEGKEDYWIEPEDIVDYAFLVDGIYKKKESIFKQVFFTHSSKESLDYKWKITNETTTIAGFNCIKATCEIKGNKFIAWFTPEIPINYGPMNLHGLPGLILQAEGFFNTIRITGIQYENDPNRLNSILEIYKTKFEKEKGNNGTKESIFLIKKAALTKQLKKMM